MCLRARAVEPAHGYLPTTTTGPRRRANRAIVEEHRQLLDAVLADPEDESARRVLADYLTEREDPRGELIHLQCEAQTVRDSWRLDAIEARANVLLAANWATWLGAVGLERRQCLFARGFVEAVRLSAEQLAAVDDRLGSLEPVRRLRVVDVTEANLPKILSRPWVQRVTMLEIDNNRLGPSAATALLSARPPNLRYLNLNGNRLSDTGVAALATTAFFAGIEYVDLGNNVIGDTGANALALCRHLATATQLELERNPMADPGVRALIASPHLRNLKRINISRGTLLPETLKALQRRFGDAWVS